MPRTRRGRMGIVWVFLLGLPTVAGEGDPSTPQASSQASSVSPSSGSSATLPPAIALTEASDNAETHPRSAPMRPPAVAEVTEKLVVLSQALHESATPPKISSEGSPLDDLVVPDDRTTGVPEDLPLAPSGPLSINEEGTVVDGVDIDGCLRVKADNVIIRRSRIRCDGSDYAIGQVDGARGLLVEDVTIDGGGGTVTSVCCSDYTVRRVNASNSEDGPRLGSRTVVEDSYIHHLSRRDGSHNDSLQSTGGTDIVVRGNNLQTYNPQTDDPFNAAIQLGSTQMPLRNVLIEGNIMNGGNYTVNIRADTDAVHVVFRGNRLGRDYRYGGLLRVVEGVTWTESNVWVDTGAPVHAGMPNQ